MAGPWEQYQQATPQPPAPSTQAAPWLAYQVPSGMRLAQPGEIPTESGMYALPSTTEEVPRSFMQRALGAVAAPLDIGLTMGSAAARGVAAPIYGLASGRGEAGVKEVLGGIRQPQTPEARAALEAAAPVFQALPPIIGAGTPALGAAPAATRQTTAAAGRGLQAAKEATVGPMLEQRKVERSIAAWERAPQIEAAREAQRLGIALNPVDIQPTAGPRLMSLAAGAKGQERIVEVNRPAVNQVARRDMGLPISAVLNSKDTFDSARAAIAEPYNKIRQIPVIQADDQAISALEALRPSETLIGGELGARKVNKLIDSALEQMRGDMSGQAFLVNISKLRKDARRIYDSKSSGPAELEVADTNMAIANILEQGAERSIFDPKLLSEYRNARERMARIYAYEAATDFNTGNVDVSKIARITSKGGVYTGDLASLGRIAGNFPDAFNIDPSAPWYQTRIARAGLGATTGTAVGAPLGVPGMAAGALAGTIVGGLGSRYAANRLASPKYQAGLQVRDERIFPPPVNQLIPEIPRERAVVPYQPEVVGPSSTSEASLLRVVSYDENGRPIYQPSGARPGFTIPPQPEFGVRPTVMETQRGLPNEVPRQIYEAQKRAELAQEFRAAAERKPATGEVILDFDPVTGRLREAQPQGAALPQPSSLQSAIDKLAGEMSFETRSQYQRVQVGTDAQGAPVYEVRSIPLTLTPAEAKKYALPTRQPQAFKLTADERVAWNKARADLAEVAPGMKALSDEAIAGKMADRQWVQQTIKTAQEKEQGLARREALLAEQLANRNNLRLLARDIEAKNKELAKIKEDRARMAAALESLEDRLRAPRPVELGGQGPKTRAAQRNQLRTAPVENNLILPD